MLFTPNQNWEYIIRIIIRQTNPENQPNPRKLTPDIQAVIYTNGSLRKKIRPWEKNLQYLYFKMESSIHQITLISGTSHCFFVCLFVSFFLFFMFVCLFLVAVVFLFLKQTWNFDLSFLEIFPDC